VTAEKPDFAAPVAENDEVLAEDADRHRQILELRRHRHRMPEPTQILTAGRARPDMGELLVRLHRRGDCVALIGLRRPSLFIRHDPLLGCFCGVPEARDCGKS
jgi:hypothetical protein